MPDYLIVTMGYPLVVIEAKSPRESTEEAYREARLYAAELNALYGHDFAPAKFIIASNGVELWYGHSDDTRPLDQVQCDALGPYSSAIAELVELMAWRKLHSLAAGLAQKTRPSELFKARRLLGGTGLQNEEVGDQLIRRNTHNLNLANFQSYDRSRARQNCSQCLRAVEASRALH